LLIDSLRALGLSTEHLLVRLSSRKAWHDFFFSHGGKPEQEYAFYQVIDKLEREEPAVTEEKLRQLGFALADVKSLIDTAEPTAELKIVLDNLSARGLREYVKIDYGVIRGLAYYTGVVFEAFDRSGDQPRAIAGGGRYDNLVKLISGGKVDLPALGFGMGDVVIMELLRERKLLPEFTPGIDVFCLIAEESFRLTTLRIVEELRWSGFGVEYSLTPAKPDKQFKRAQELRAGRILTLARNEAGEVVARIKDLKTRQETSVSVEKVVEELKRTPT